MDDISKESYHNFNPQLKAINTTINTVKPLAYEESVT